MKRLMKLFPCPKRELAAGVSVPAPRASAAGNTKLSLPAPTHPYVYLPIPAPEEEASGERVWGALRNSIKGNPGTSSGERLC